MENKTYTNIRCFAEAVSREVSRKMGKDYEIKLQEVRKNNGVLLQGLIILSETRNLSPTIYLNSFWELYVSGTPMERISRMVMEAYRKNLPEDNVDMSFFREYDKVRSRICYRLVNTNKNRTLLDQVPHIDLLDLSLCFYYAYEDKKLGNGSILIHNNHMENWNCTTEMLLKEAARNTEQLYPRQLYGMSELLEEYTGEDMEVPMKVLTNTARCNGATCIVYPGALKEIAESMQDDLYILPSSVHEVILMAAHDVEEEEKLQGIIREVNHACVEPEEILSDSLYFYHQKENRIDNLSHTR